MLERVDIYLISVRTTDFISKMKADRLAALKELRSRLHPLCKHLYWRADKQTNEIDSDKQDADEKEPEAPLAVKTKEQLLVEGRLISSIYFDEISSGLTQELLKSHEDMIAEALAQLVPPPLPQTFTT